jgi:small multidrug resistance family-3 protein
VSAAQIFGLLLLAAILEAGGDFLVRSGMYSGSSVRYYGLIITGGVVLATYGYAVNRVTWDFARLLGTYVIVFFLVTQIIGFVATRELPAGLEFIIRPTFSSLLRLVGSILVVIGGILFAIGQHIAPLATHTVKSR